jgi:hypothetical protein
MNRVISSRRMVSVAATLGFVACVALGAMPAFGQEESNTAKIPTVYRDAYTITIKGKPDANGTFSMVFKPHGEDGTEFTVNVVKGMGAKKVAADVAKELTIATGDRYKVKHNDKKVVVKKRNKKSPPLAIEMTNQKFTGMSIMIGK